jgi:hypothetical protein
VGGQLVSEWADADDEAWIATQRDVAEHYLESQRLQHGGVAPEPAWHISPYLAIWPVGSLAAPGAVGWWVITGDVPTDYCSFEDGSHPRAVASHFAQSWREAVRDPHEDGTLGVTGLPIELRDLLSSRAKILAEFVQDDEIWLIAEDEWI